MYDMYCISETPLLLKGSCLRKSSITFDFTKSSLTNHHPPTKLPIFSNTTSFSNTSLSPLSHTSQSPITPTPSLPKRSTKSNTTSLKSIRPLQRSKSFKHNYYQAKQEISLSSYSLRRESKRKKGRRGETYFLHPLMLLNPLGRARSRIFWLVPITHGYISFTLLVFSPNTLLPLPKKIKNRYLNTLIPPQKFKISKERLSTHTHKPLQPPTPPLTPPNDLLPLNIFLPRNKENTFRLRSNNFMLWCKKSYESWVVFY